MQKLNIEDLLKRQEDIDAKRAQIKYLIATVVSAANRIMSEGHRPDADSVRNRPVLSDHMCMYDARWSQDQAEWLVSLQLRDKVDQIVAVSFYWNDEMKFTYRNEKFEFRGETYIIRGRLQFFMDKMSAMLTMMPGQLAAMFDHL